MKEFKILSRCEVCNELCDAYIDKPLPIKKDTEIVNGQPVFGKSLCTKHAYIHRCGFVAVKEVKNQNLKEGYFIKYKDLIETGRMEFIDVFKCSPEIQMYLTQTGYLQRQVAMPEKEFNTMLKEKMFTPQEELPDYERDREIAQSTIVCGESNG